MPGADPAAVIGMDVVGTLLAGEDSRTVLSDDYDPLIASAIAQTPATWPVIRRVRTVLV
jgi:hypothetical protein